MDKQRIYLAGNPNCGKSTLFNCLTGAKQKVGNWPGVTVDRRSGHYDYDGQRFEVIDLPGLYELSVFEAGSIDHQIAFNAIYQRDMDWVINIVDGANLERNLYLTIQLLEMGVPVILAVNMMDVAKRHGIQLDLDLLSRQLNCPVVPMVCRRKRGVEQLKQVIASPKIKRSLYQVPYPKPITAAVAQCASQLTQQGMSPADSHFMAIRLLEGEMLAVSKIAPDSEVMISLEQTRKQLESDLALELDIVFADGRYHFIHEIVKKCQTQARTLKKRVTAWVDKLVLNRFLGVPIFLLVMYLMFEFAITLGTALQPFFDQGSTVIFINGVMYWGQHLGLPSWLDTILAHGVGLGINTVLTFVPQIACMFIFLAVLEDSGYMSRAALVMDRLMQKMGLPGKAFVPLIVGFGCNVPSILATRTLDSHRDRLLTMMMSPFMSCGARLAIFAVFASAFFPRNGAFIVFLLYLIGVAAAIVTGLILNRWVLRGQHEPYLMELPSYHLPNFKTVTLHAWQRLRRFIFRAGRLIVPICLLVGSLNAINLHGQVIETGSKDSILASVARVITPVLAPMGIHQNNWPATVGLLTGTLAKEVVIGTLNTLYSQPHIHHDTAQVQEFQIDPVLRCDLQYALDIPMGVLMGKMAELYFLYNNQVVPFNVMSPGRIFALWSVLDPSFSWDEGRLWNIKAGARSTFMLPKVGDALAHKKLVQHFDMKSGVPKKLSDHWGVFQELATFEEEPRWSMDVLFFSKQWFENRDDPAWRLFSHYLYQYAWKHSNGFRNRLLYDFIYSCIQNERKLKPNPYVIDTVKHLIGIGQKNFPGFRVCDSDEALPYQFIQKAYVDIYQLKQYAPLMMRLDYLNEESELPLYYSLHWPTLLEFAPKSKKLSSHLFDLREIKYIMQALVTGVLKNDYRLRDSEASIYHMVQKVDFECFHSDPDIFNEVMKTQDLLTQDARMQQQIQPFGDMEFCDNSPFYKGCVRIGVRET